MFAKMMHEMKNRNSNYQVNSYSRHGDNKMDKMRMMMKMMKMSNMMNDHSSSSYHSDDNDMYDMFSEMFDSSSDRMDNYRSSDYSNQMGRMSHFKNMFNNMRYKRAAGDNLDLGDRLVEKLAEQKHHMEAKIGNMTCVMKELNVLDASNNIDIQAMKRDIQMYTKCTEKAKTKLCMHQDIKKKVESNFGPMEDILQETQLTEHEFFPLVMQLLHGKEMDYMTGGM